MYEFKIDSEEEGFVIFTYRGPRDEETLTARVPVDALYLFLDILRKRPLIEGMRISLYLGGKGGRA